MGLFGSDVKARLRGNNCLIIKVKVAKGFIKGFYNLGDGGMTEARRR